MPRPPNAATGQAGLTLIEIVVVLGIALVALALAAPWAAADRLALARAARLAESHLSRARLHAVAGHAAVSVSARGHALELRDAAGGLIALLRLDGGSLRALDSIHVRPATIRFNPRGQGSAGSIYLYRGRRGVRVLSNFVGRVRTTRFRF